MVTKACKTFICTAFAVLLFVAALMSVGAAIDTTRTGSVTFTINSSDTGETIGGGSIAVYRVASVDSNGIYMPESDFASLDFDVNTVAADETAWSTAAETIALYIKNHSLEDTATVVPVDANGNAAFKNVVPGLYAVLQNEAPKGYTAFKPFVLPLPYQNGDELQYDLYAKPKGTSKLPAEENTLTFPAVTKTIRGADDAVKTEFRFRFKALEQGYPQIVNSSGAVENGGDVVSQNEDEIIVRTIGAGSVDIGSITFDTPGDYYFEASEINTHEPGYQYDKTVYWCKYSIEYNEEHNALKLSGVTVKTDNANGRVLYEGEELPVLSFDFVNYLNTTPYKGTPVDDTVDKGSLPQTGQIWWPMIVLAAAGIVCLLFGVIIMRRSKKAENREQK